jgi:hypothetical protein
MMYQMQFLSLSLPNLALLAAAGAACGYVAVQIGRSLLALRWPTAQGEIVDARAVRMSDGESTKVLGEVVTYRYHVGGQLYSNNRLRFGVEPTPMSIVPVGDGSYAASSVTARYPHGTPVRVYYNPRRPEDSVLHPTPNFRVWIILVVGLYAGYAALNGVL